MNRVASRHILFSSVYKSSYMSSMSTPLQNLPQGAAPPPTAKMDDDPAVADVINEMQMEFHHTQPQQPKAAMQQHVAAPPIPNPYIVTTHITPPASPKSDGSAWLHPEAAKRAAIVAVIAFVLLHPCDMSHMYEKLPIISKAAQYDRLIRLAMLALVLYVLFWKLKL